MSPQRTASPASSASSASRSPTERRGSRHGDFAQRPADTQTQSAPVPRRRHRRGGHRGAPLMGSVDAFNAVLGGGGGGGGGLGGRPGSAFYLQPNLSGVSMDSTALLDHREQVSMRPRRASTAANTNFDTNRTSARHRQYSFHQHDGHRSGETDSDDSSSEGDQAETVPLVRTERADERGPLLVRHRALRPSSGPRRPSTDNTRLSPPMPVREYGSVNFPPSVPGSPQLEPAHVLGGLHGIDLSVPRLGGAHTGPDGDAIIQIAPDVACDRSYPPSLSHSSPRSQGGHALRSSMHRAEEDVCFPVDDGLMDDEGEASMHEFETGCRTPRVRRQWPDMSVLEEWSREEKEERSEGIRAKKLPEPVYVGGRLRPPVRAEWHRDEDELPYRFTYFNEDLPATIHSHTISELLQPGQSFTDLFRPEPRVLVDSSEDEEEVERPPRATMRSHSNAETRDSRTDITPPEPSQSLPRLGPRPTFWLDVFRPTDAEMKVISMAFGIHPLTTEDIMMQEAREKVELFRSYYLVSYRTFEQDSNSEDYMEPVNIYVVVFRDGVISFHFSMTPHPANVRRRIRQLKDYIAVSADWISYALIDDITDAFQPLIQSLEDQVDAIDDAILRMHLEPDSSSSAKNSAPSPGSEVSGEEQKSDGEMLKRVGDSRRAVMSLYRLMGNKADVIKGFAKRCNEQWQVAPRSEIGLYLGDIQDHIVTMVSNLNHMEKILSRSHSNYLAQINIKMNERQERTADVLGRLTVLGTIVLPMNIITGLWGMNVMVPGQEIGNLDWFWCITAGLFIFGFLCYYVAKRVYKIM